MPLALVVGLVPPPDLRSLPDAGLQGAMAHAAFLALAAQVDPGWGARLHGVDSDRAKPFTLSPLLDGGGERPAPRAIQEGERLCLRVTSLDPKLSGWLKPALAGPGLSLRLGDAVFGVAEGALRSSEVGYEELAAPMKTLAGPKIRLRFATPTTFRSGERNLLFPSPGLVFAGLREKWNQFSGLPVPVIPAAAFDESLNVTRYELATSLLNFGRYRQIGFSGTCEYQAARGADRSVLQSAAVLARFALYAGVGYKTTMGMGQVRLVRQE